MSDRLLMTPTNSDRPPRPSSPTAARFIINYWLFPLSASHRTMPTRSPPMPPMMMPTNIPAMATIPAG